jgi:uncharacterized protein
MKSKAGAILLLILLASLSVWADTLSVPQLTRRVTDQTNLLSNSEVQSLEAELQQFEEQTSNQIVVLMIQSLNGEDLEDYSMRVSEKNKMGKKGRDNGVLLIIAKDERQMRIEVGYGLEGSLTDALSSEIIRDVIAPHFRDNDYAGGIAAGIQAIEQATKGEYQGEPQSGRHGRGSIGSFGLIAFIIFFIFIRMIFTRAMYVGSRGVVGRGIWWGGMGGFGGGGFGGGGFGGGGFGGGGFSGGGGGFGGGGASGGW